jgi:hypothetical protein
MRAQATGGHPRRRVTHAAGVGPRTVGYQHASPTDFPKMRIHRSFRGHHFYNAPRELRHNRTMDPTGREASKMIGC